MARLDIEALSRDSFFVVVNWLTMKVHKVSMAAVNGILKYVKCRYAIQHYSRDRPISNKEEAAFLKCLCKTHSTPCAKVSLGRCNLIKETANNAHSHHISCYYFNQRKGES